MVYLDGFSGYGGFHLGFEKAGWKFNEVYFSEIDKYAIANYSYNFPQSKYAGSITTISRDTIPNIDLFTFGWPCQDNSIAGKRKGQTSGTRSGLLHEAVRIINEFKPRNFVAENVLGLLSVNKGIDIVESFKLLSDLNENCPQYDIEMQLLNTRWVLPQNRERLFFVGHLRGSGSRQIFPIGEDSKPFQQRDIIVQGTTVGKECSRLGDRDLVLGVDGISTCLQSTDYKQPIQVLVPNGRVHHWRETDDSITGVQKNGSNASEHVYLKKTGIAATIIKARAPMVVEDISKWIVRKLTPIECERLQGLPDNHTQYGMFDGEVKEISDTQRYRLCGNGVTVDIVELIAKKLKSQAS